MKEQLNVLFISFQVYKYKKTNQADKSLTTIFDSTTSWTPKLFFSRARLALSKMIDVTVFWAKNCILGLGRLFLTLFFSQDVKDTHNKIITSMDISCPHSNWSYSKYQALQRSTLFVILTYSIGFQVNKLGFSLSWNINLIPNGFYFFLHFLSDAFPKTFFLQKNEMEDFVICGKTIICYYTTKAAQKKGRSCLTDVACQHWL